jgi:hypothetical protein
MSGLYTAFPVQDYPEILSKHRLSQSPTVIVDGKLIFQGLPPLAELRRFFSTPTEKVSRRKA